MSELEDLELFAAKNAEIEELTNSLRRTQAKLGKAEAKVDEMVDAVYRAAKDAALMQGPPAPVMISDWTSVSGRPETALIHLTDLQYGKKTDSYNMQVCEERVNYFAEKVHLINAIQRQDHPVDSGVLMLGGDMLEGEEIFPGQVYEIEAYLYEQMFGIRKVQRSFIRELLTDFETLDVYVKEGNHGRKGRRGEWPATDNHDLMVYQMLQDDFEDDPRVIWHPRKTWYQIVTIGAYRALLIHGDEIKGFGGSTPAFAIQRKGIAWSSGSIPEDFKDIYMGHWHVPMVLPLANGGRIFLTGSTESDNEYAREWMAARGDPSQRLNYIDPRKGRVAAEYVIWLDDDD